MVQQMSIFEIVIMMALMAVILWFAIALGNALIRAYLHGRRFKKKKRKYIKYNKLLKLGLYETAYIFTGYEFMNASNAELLLVYALAGD